MAHTVFIHIQHHIGVHIRFSARICARKLTVAGNGAVTHKRPLFFSEYTKRPHAWPFLQRKDAACSLHFLQKQEKLRSKLRAAFAAAGSQNFAAVHAFGTGQKAMLFRAVNLFGLERSFHASHLLFLGKPPTYCGEFYLHSQGHTAPCQRKPCKLEVYLKEWLSVNLFFKNGALAFPSVQCKKSKRTMPFYKYNIKWPAQLYLCWYSTSKCDII